MEERSIVFLLSKEDFSNICRCCLSLTPLSSIFEIMYEETPLVNIFCSLFGTQLDPNDDLPKKICESCIGEVLHCYNFKKRFKSLEIALQSVIIKSEPSEGNLELGGTQLEEKTITKKINADFGDEERCNEEGIVEKKQKKSKVFTCSCEETFATKLEFRKHRESTSHSILRKHPCEVCDKLFTKAGLWQHRKVHDAIKQYSCDQCMMRFATSGNLQRHKMIHTGEKPHVCDFCGKAFIQLGALTKHRRIHTGEKPHVCDFCGKAFIQLVALISHKRIHTGEKPYLCSFCGASFRSKFSYKIHMQHHNHQKSQALKHPIKKVSKGKNPKTTFVCNKCGRQCYSQGAYKVHLYSHGLGTEQMFESDRYRCEICMKFYATQSALTSHMLIHKNEKRFLCSECGKGFYSKAPLEFHVLTHSGEKPLTCEICGKKFARPQNLQKHLHVHTGERPFACALCPKKFRQSTHLTGHLTVHTGERPYVCKLCSKSFPHKGTHDLHVRMHTGEKPFKCDLCTNMFYDSGSLKKHKQRKHSQI